MKKNEIYLFLVFFVKKNNPLLSLMGAPQFCTRLDVEPSTHKSPCKPLFGFEFNRNFMKNTNVS